MSKSQDVKYIDECCAGQRLDVALQHLFPSKSRSAFQDLLEQGSVLVNGLVCKKRYRVVCGDCIQISWQESASLLEPESMPLSILYEDDAIIVVNKPPGLVVHPAPGNMRGTFVQGLLAHCNNLDKHDPIRPGIVHRLDKETSGVLLAAKKREFVWALSAQFQERLVLKEYIAIVSGSFQGAVVVKEPIGRDPRHREKMAVRCDGKEAFSSMISLRCGEKISCVKILPKTGRTHQIRVHLQWLGYPILGDRTYGSSVSRTMAHRQLLHCSAITFMHPLSQKEMRVEAPLFEDMAIYMEGM